MVVRRNQTKPVGRGSQFDDDVARRQNIACVADDSSDDGKQRTDDAQC